MNHLNCHPFIRLVHLLNCPSAGCLYMGSEGTIYYYITIYQKRNPLKQSSPKTYPSITILKSSPPAPTHASKLLIACCWHTLNSNYHLEHFPEDPGNGTSNPCTLTWTNTNTCGFFSFCFFLFQTTGNLFLSTGHKLKNIAPPPPPLQTI